MSRTNASSRSESMLVTFEQTIPPTALRCDDDLTLEVANRCLVCGRLVLENSVCENCGFTFCQSCLIPRNGMLLCEVCIQR